MRYNHCGVIVRHTLRAPSGAPPGKKGQIPGKAFEKKKRTLHVRESNPGRLRDRQKCYQLHQHGPARGGIIET